jgi:hypothetical protein
MGPGSSALLHALDNKLGIYKLTGAIKIVSDSQIKYIALAAYPYTTFRG